MWGMSYIPLGEASVDAPCITLGHFYEEYECIYCAARYCATELGGHSFERFTSKLTEAGEAASPRHCYQCKQTVVSLLKH